MRRYFSYIRSGSQRHRHFAGFFNVPVLHRYGTTLYIRWFRHTAPFSRLLRHAGDTEEIFSTWPSRRPHGAQRLRHFSYGSFTCPHPPPCLGCIPHILSSQVDFDGTTIVGMEPQCPNLPEVENLSHRDVCTSAPTTWILTTHPCSW